jgi:twinkle protein
MAQKLTISRAELDAVRAEHDIAMCVKTPAEYFDDLLEAFSDKPVTDPDVRSTKLRGMLHFRSGEVTAWVGYNGHRKSMFTSQVALDLVAQGRKVLIMSLEMQPGRTLHRMARQASGIARPSRGWLERFALSTTGLYILDHVGRLGVDEALAVVRYFADKLDGTDVFIDSMMMVCASEESMDEQKQFTTALVRIAQETEQHVHLVAHCRKPQIGEDKPPTKYDLRGSASISDQCANVVTVWANKEKSRKLSLGDLSVNDDPDALVTVEKQRNGTFEGRVKLWFDDASLRFCDDRHSRVLPLLGAQ